MSQSSQQQYVPYNQPHYSSTDPTYRGVIYPNSQPYNQQTQITQIQTNNNVTRIQSIQQPLYNPQIQQTIYTNTSQLPQNVQNMLPNYNNNVNYHRPEIITSNNQNINSINVIPQGVTTVVYNTPQPQYTNVQVQRNQSLPQGNLNKTTVITNNVSISSPYNNEENKKKLKRNDSKIGGFVKSLLYGSYNLNNKKTTVTTTKISSSQNGNQRNLTVNSTTNVDNSNRSSPQMMNIIPDIKWNINISQEQEGISDNNNQQNDPINSNNNDEGQEGN